jgi:predicted nucleic acid-binding protein
MSWLFDTSVLIRSVQVGTPRHSLALQAAIALESRKEVLCIVPQNFVEFWAVATRPKEANGLGFSIDDTRNEIGRLKLLFVLENEDETVFENWEGLVEKYAVSGKPTHDARIVAAMQTHNIENLLTFNVADFKRYSPIINVFAPEDVI